MSPRAKWLLKALVACGLLGWLLSTVDVAALWRLLAGQSPLALMAMTAIQLLGIVVATVKWRVLLPAQTFGCLFRLNMVAQFYSLIVPGQVGAEAIKAYHLGRGRADAESIAASVVLDKVTGLLSLIALGLAGALLTTLQLGESLRLALVAMFVLGVAALLGLRLPMLRALVLATGDRFSRLSPKLERPFKQFGRFVEAWCAYLGQPVALVGSLFIGLLQHSIYIGMIVLLSRQFGFELVVFEWCWIFALVSVAGVLPITLAGVGVREGVFVGLLAAFAIPAEKALALSLTMFALHVFFGLMGGAYEFLRPPRSS